jgi:hypothetical protein
VVDGALTAPLAQVTHRQGDEESGPQESDDYKKHAAGVLVIATSALRIGDQGTRVIPENGGY